MPPASRSSQKADSDPQCPAVGRIGDLQRRIETVLRPLLPTSGRYAFVDYPNHDNLGDSAIWLGSARFLRELTGKAPVYVSETGNHSSRRLAERLGSGTIFIQGGGNFGDIWADHHALREQLLVEFPDNPIVQLPQSIKFYDRAALDRARDIIRRREQFVLLVRDRESLDIARNEFSCPSHLCPDMAFCLGPLRRPAMARYAIAFLLRTDLEAREEYRLASAPAAADVVFDWLLDRPKLATRLGARLARRSDRFAIASGYHHLICDYVAAARVKRGCALLSQGQAVVTDRLHGHILCLLLGIPHAILDNNYGKVSSFHETWTRDFPDVLVAGSIEEAARWARQRSRLSA